MSMPWVEGSNFHYADPITPGQSVDPGGCLVRICPGRLAGPTRSPCDAYKLPIRTHIPGLAGYVELSWGFFDYRTAVQTRKSGKRLLLKDTYFQSVDQAANRRRTSKVQPHLK
jgi:hypothetical protein